MHTDLELWRNTFNEKVLAIDIETKDPNLKEDGPGSIRQDGFICGISLASHTLGACYLPIAHGSGNMDKELVFRFLRDLSKTFSGELLGANILYDLEWLASYGIKFKHAKLVDIQIVEALIDENQSKYNLDSLAVKYCGIHKAEEDMIAYAATLGIAEKDVKSHMDLYSAEMVEKYAKMDAQLCLDIYEKQKETILSESLGNVLDLECRLTPLILEMRLKGVRVDVEKAEQLNKELLVKEEELLLEFNKLVGWDCNPRSADDLLKVFEPLGVELKQTKAGGASFAEYVLKDYMQHEDVKVAELAKVVHDYRAFNKNRSDFIEGTIIEKHINGRIHGQFHQIRGDEYGTRTGRMSASNPNLQQQPSRDPFWKKTIRGLYLPDEGMMWDRHDYSQQELRLMVHYAALKNFPGVQPIVDRYNEDPSTDFHTTAAQIAGIERRPAKDISFGICYGMGKKKLCKSLGRSEEEGLQILEKYHHAFPYVKRLTYDTTSLGKTRGYIRTFMGRRGRFNKWEPVKNQEDWKVLRQFESLPLEEAMIKYPGRRLERSGAFRALNKLIQGSAADLTKLAMVTAYEQYGDVPHLQVHDELDYSHSSIEEVLRRKNTMETCYKFKVPMKVDSEVGPNWYEGTLVE